MVENVFPKSHYMLWDFIDQEYIYLDREVAQIKIDNEEVNISHSRDNIYFLVSASHNPISNIIRSLSCDLYK